MGPTKTQTVCNIYQSNIILTQSPLLTLMFDVRMRQYPNELLVNAIIHIVLYRSVCQERRLPLRVGTVLA